MIKIGRDEHIAPLQVSHMAMESRQYANCRGPLTLVITMLDGKVYRVEDTRSPFDGVDICAVEKAILAAHEAARAADRAAAGVLDEIAAERRRQVEVEGWTTQHDNTHDKGELAAAAACYASFAGLSDKDRQAAAAPGSPFKAWPFSIRWWKPKSRRRDLVVAAALIAAEIERLDRAEN